ncbi:uncharacterized protein V6R79_018113 [Siganus canaliculatus]
MSSPGLSSGTPKSTELFEELWRQLGECHQNAVQELEAKVSKLKKERCLDAQRLEVFYNRNQQLKEQNKALQDAMGLLEERLRAGECDRCAILKEDMQNDQQHNLRLIAKLKNERNSLEDENRKLHSELQKLRTRGPELQQASSPEHEEGIIPDSPVLPSSLPVASKLRKRRNLDQSKHVRYREMPLLQSNNSLFREMSKEPVEAAKHAGMAEVLVPNTCELETSPISNDANLNMEEPIIAETCGLELVDYHHMKSEKTAGGQSSSTSPWSSGVPLKSYCSSPLSTVIHNPDSTTDRSPSLLPRAKHLSEACSINKAKRKKEEAEPEVPEEDKQGVQEELDKQRTDKHTQHQRVKTGISFLGSQRDKTDLLERKIRASQNGTSSQSPKVSCSSPTFKKPSARGEAIRDVAGRRGKPLQELNASSDHNVDHNGEMKHKVEPMWSIDPALAMSMYDSEEEEEQHGELVDTDCTWVSHSLLQRQEENQPDRRPSVSGLGNKANDSLEMMFDTTVYGEYKSYSGSQSQPCDDEEDADEENEDLKEDEQDAHDNTMSPNKEPNAGQPTFAHMAVIRKKDERRKLKGTTCKECDIYYAHLPEEERQKKLSACSRHRFLYIPPCTPENFWEVGFPSTQTCIDRGYIKEEKNPVARTRRRQPFNALFSPKRKKQES